MFVMILAEFCGGWGRFQEESGHRQFLVCGLLLSSGIGLVLSGESQGKPSSPVSNG